MGVQPEAGCDPTQDVILLGSFILFGQPIETEETWPTVCKRHIQMIFVNDDNRRQSFIWDNDGLLHWRVYASISLNVLGVLLSKMNK